MCCSGLGQQRGGLVIELSSDYLIYSFFF
jgi:HrpA-like RNA helicase